jgi:hypothetical protein
MAVAQGLRNGCDELFEGLRQEDRQAVIKPVDFGPARRGDAGKDDRPDLAGHGLRIDKRQRRAPGGAEYQPAFHAKSLPQCLDIPDQVLRRIISKAVAEIARIRCAFPAATLIELDNAPHRRIEMPPGAVRHAGPRPAMQQQRRFAVGVAGEGKEDPVAVGPVEEAGLVWG